MNNGKLGLISAYLSRFTETLCWILLISWLFCGLSLIFIFPPFQTPDENSHWISANHRIDRVFGTSESLCDYSYSIAKKLEPWEYIGKTLKSFNTNLIRNINAPPLECKSPFQEVTYGNIFTYPGVLFSRLLTAPILHSPEQALKVFYLSRVFNLLVVFAFLLFFLRLAIRHSQLPLALGIMCLFNLPLVIQQSFAINSDLSIIIFSLCIIIFLINPTKPNLYLTTFFSFIALFTKPILSPVVFFLGIHLLLNRKLLNRRKLQIYYSALFFLISIVAIFYGKTVIQSGQSLPNAANPSLQWNNILEHPTRAFGVILSGVLERLNAGSFIYNLGWFDTSVSIDTFRTFRAFIYFCFILLLLLYCLRFKLSCFSRRKLLIQIGYLCSTSVSALISSLAMYLAYTPVASNQTMGMQPRYLISSALIVIGTMFLNHHSSKQSQNTAAKSGPIFQAMNILAATWIVTQLYPPLWIDLLGRYW